MLTAPIKSTVLALTACSFIAAASAQDAAPTAKPAASEATAKEPSSEPTEKSAEDILKEEKASLALKNALIDERVKHETAEMRAEIARLNAEKSLIEARLAHAAAKRNADDEVKNVKLAAEKERYTREAKVAEARAKALGNKLKAVQAESGIELAELENQIKKLETAAKRKSYADAEPEYLEKPLQDDGMLVISDRRIPLNGPISQKTAEMVTTRIHYYNNQNPKQPIFIVIDSSPGGSVMAGYRILKMMESSDAPIHVVVKSYAASMAAAITTLAEESYAYPNAVILHHQISSTIFGRMNLTEQKEFVEETQRWWDRFGAPIAEKMGITKKEFIEKMYAESSRGDWSEFADEAQKLKWVNHIISGVEETSFRRDPNAKKSSSKSSSAAQFETGLDENGRPVMYLPRLNPKDFYYLYNPDNYYRVR